MPVPDKIRRLENGVRRNKSDDIAELAFILENGTDGVKKDVGRAKELYEKAARQGHAQAMHNLACMLTRGDDGVEEDAPQAVILFQKAIRKRHIPSYNSLGILLESGADGVRQDAVRAKEHYHRAIDNGHVPALYNLADLLENGADGVPKDPARAVQLYEQAIEQGHLESLTALGNLVHEGDDGIESDSARAKELYEQGAERGDRNATAALATLLHDGEDGVEQDAVRASKLYIEAIEKGHVASLNGLAVMLHDGKPGVQKDVILAKELYEKAIKCGNIEALNGLAVMLRSGDEGVPQDGVRAQQLYEQAISKGHADAKIGLAMLFQEGASGVDADPIRAKALYEEAIENGSSHAAHALAVFLHEGADGLEAEPVRAKELYEVAISNGDVEALCGLAALLLDGADGVPQDGVRAKELFEESMAKGYYDAYISLATLFRDGAPGVERNVHRAKRLYEDAIAKDDTFGLIGLAVLLNAGYGGVEQDVEKAKRLFEEALEKGESSTKECIMAWYGHMLMSGCQEVRDYKRAHELLEHISKPEDERNWHNVGFLGLGLLYQHGGDGIYKDIALAKRCYTDAIEVFDNNRVSYDLGSIFQFLFESAGEQPVPIPQTLFKWIRRTPRSLGKLFLGNLLFSDPNSEADEIGRANSLFEEYLRDEDQEDVVDFLKSLQQRYQEKHASKFAVQRAYINAVVDESTVTRDLIMTALSTPNIRSMDEVFAGHKLLYLARNIGVITNEDTNGSTELGWHIQRNFYFAASRLVSADRRLLEFIFHDAQVKGIIDNGMQFVISSELSADMNIAMRQIHNAFESILKRFVEIEEHMGSMKQSILSTSQFVSVLAKDLNRLQDLFKKKNRFDKYTALASCMLSLIPIIGKTIGESAKIGADFFIGLGLEDGLTAMGAAAEYRISEDCSVNLCDFRTALYVFSEQGAMKRIDVGSRRSIIDAVEKSGFENLSQLQRSIIEQIRDSQKKDDDSVPSDNNPNGTDTKENADSNENASNSTEVEGSSSPGYEKAEATTTVISSEKPDCEASARTAADDDITEDSEEVDSNPPVREPRAYSGDSPTSEIGPSPSLLPILKMFHDFTEKILKNGNKLEMMIAQYIFKGFLDDLKKNGVINEAQVQRLNVEQMISEHDQNKNGLVETDELEAIIKVILTDILQH